MSETININTYPIQETITVNTVEDVTTINVNVIQSTGAVTSVNEQTGDVVLTLGNLSNDVGYITSEDIPENVVKIVASTPNNQFAYAHGTVTIGNKMIIGTRQGANSKLLRYSGTTLEEIITIPCYVAGLESIVKKSDESRIYGIRYYNGVSYIWDADPLDFTDINFNVVTGINLTDSPAICTDDTYIYGVTQGSALFFKIRISDWTTISTNSWTSRTGGHWCAINTVDGLFYATNQAGYLATVSTTDLSFTELDLTSYLQTITDDNVYIPAEFNNFGYNALIVGGETKGNNTGLGACIVDVDTNTIYPFDILPTVGLWASNDYTKLYNTSNAGFIQVWDLQDIIWLVTVNQPYFNNTFTYRGNGFPNELLQPTDGFLYMTNWDTVNGTGVLSKIELTPVSQPIITQKEAYYNSLNSGNALASTDDLAEGTTNLYFTNSRAVSALSSALSLKEDSSNKSTSTSDSASTTKFPVWSAILSYFDASRIKTILGISTLSGSNTGDQDLSSYATTSALTSGLATKEATITAGTTSQYYRGDKSWQTLDRTAVGLGSVDYIALTSPYVLANQTTLQKMFNVGSGSGGAFNASANKTYRFRIEFDLTGLSASSGTISFGFLGTAVITSINYKMNATKNALATITAANIQSIQTTAVTVITAATTNTVAKGMASGTIRVTTAGTIIPAISTSVGVTTAQVEANSFCEFVEIGSNTLTATSNIS